MSDESQSIQLLNVFKETLKEIRPYSIIEKYFANLPLSYRLLILAAFKLKKKIQDTFTFSAIWREIEMFFKTV